MLTRAFTIVSAALLLSLPVYAQKSSSDADTREIENYRLTAQTLGKLKIAMQSLADQAKSDPKVQAHMKLQAEVDSLGKLDELTDAQQARLEKLQEQLENEDNEKDGPDLSNASLAETAAAIEKQPMAAAALRKSGLTAREYLVASMALFQASAFAEMKKSGMIKELPKEANAANVAFVQEHAAELAAMQQLMQQMNKKGGD